MPTQVHHFAHLGDARHDRLRALALAVARHAPLQGVKRVLRREDGWQQVLVAAVQDLEQSGERPAVGVFLAQVVDDEQVDARELADAGTVLPVVACPDGIEHGEGGDERDRVARPHERLGNRARLAGLARSDAADVVQAGADPGIEGLDEAHRLGTADHRAQVAPCDPGTQQLLFLDLLFPLLQHFPLRLAASCRALAIALLADHPSDDAVVADDAELLVRFAAMLARALDLLPVGKAILDRLFERVESDFVVHGACFLSLVFFPFWYRVQALHLPG